MATEFPLAGSFTTYSARFVDEPFGFAIGWNYCLNDVRLATSTLAVEAHRVLLGAGHSLGRSFFGPQRLTLLSSSFHLHPQTLGHLYSRRLDRRSSSHGLLAAQRKLGLASFAFLPVLPGCDQLD